MKKRGRAISIIVMIITIILLAGILFVFRDKIGFAKEIDPSVVLLDKTIEECVESTLTTGTRLVGLQGGYVIMPETYLQTESSKIAYGYYEGSETLPSKSEIEDQISNYVEITLPICFDENDFTDFKIEEKKAEAKTRIKSSSVSISVDFPVDVSKDGMPFTLSETYSTEIPVRLGRIYSVAEEIIKKQIDNPDIIDFSYLAESEYDIAILSAEEKMFVYSITDESSKIDDIPFTFRFANKLR